MKTSNKLWRLRMILWALDLDQIELARVSGIGEPNLSEILTGKIDADKMRQKTLNKINAGLIQVMESGRLWADLKQG